MNKEKQMVGIEEGLASVDRCFSAIGEAAAGPIMDVVAALRERELLASEVAVTDDRIQIAALENGLPSYRKIDSSDPLIVELENLRTKLIESPMKAAYLQAKKKLADTRRSS